MPAGSDAPELFALHEALADQTTLDRNWTLISLTEAVRLKQELAEDAGWDPVWLPFAEDGCGNTLFLEAPRGAVVLQRLDPPGHRKIAPNLGAWLTELVERLEGEANGLPTNHPQNLALLWAVKDGDLEGARRALDCGADPAAEDDIPLSALALAAKNAASLELVRVLLDRGADTSRPSWKPPLFCAIEHRNVHAAELLLERGVNPDQRETYYGKTPLIAAVRTKELALIRSLLRRRADVNARTILGTGVNSELSLGETALIQAAAVDAFEVLCLLLEHGADPNIPSESTGDTALIHAIRRRNRLAMERLLDAGADPNAVNKRGKRPLDIAAETIAYSRRAPVDPQIVQQLKERGARES